MSPADDPSAGGVRGALQEALRSRLSGELRLPLLPETAGRVLAACRDERTKTNDLAGLIQRDPSLAAHLLRVANSITYAPRVPILSLQQAIGRVGLAAVYDVAVAVALKERAFAAPGHEERIRELWLHSVATACYAREIAELLRGDIESAFLCGLLHDVGMSLTLQLVCDLEREGAVPRASRADVEAVMLEFHCEVGARLADSWKLGPWIGTVIRHHHAPANARTRLDELRVIALADVLAYWALDASRKERDFAAEKELEGLARLHEGALSLLLRRRERVLSAVEAFG